MLTEIKKQAEAVIKEFVESAEIKEGSLAVIGCSTSEIIGSKIGSNSVYDVAKELFDTIYPILSERKIELACQCCEHLNRALVVEKRVAEKYGCEIVAVIPQPKAGGSWATSAYEKFSEPCMVEFIKADAGIDIGGTLIGMHLKHVAVPVRLSLNKIGEANIICAKTRPKYIGGERAKYKIEA